MKVQGNGKLVEAFDAFVAAIRGSGYEAEGALRRVGDSGSLFRAEVFIESPTRAKEGE